MEKRHKNAGKDREAGREKKGVTATPTDIREASVPSDNENVSQKDGIETVKDELRTVINSMGPSTPHLLSQHTSSEADNEESYYSSSSLSYLAAQVSQSENSSGIVRVVVEESETVEDISEMSTLTSDSVYTRTCKECDGIFGDEEMQRHLETCSCRLYTKRMQNLKNANVGSSKEDYVDLVRQSTAKSRDLEYHENPVKQPTRSVNQNIESLEREYLSRHSLAANLQQTNTRSHCGIPQDSRQYPTKTSAAQPNLNRIPTITSSNEMRSSNTSTELCQNVIVPSALPDTKPKFWNLSNIFGPNALLSGINTSDDRKKNNKEKAMDILSSFLKLKKSNLTRDPLELYKINIGLTDLEHCPPRKIVFELVGDLPKPDTNTVATNTGKGRPTRRSGIQVNTLSTSYNSMMVTHQISQTDNKGGSGDDKNFDGNHKISMQTFPCEQPNQTCDQPTKVDVYYFDHGNASYYKTTDCAPVLMTEILAEKTENYTMKFWAQFYGTIHIGFAFVTSFVLQTLRFYLQSLVRPLTVGVLQLSSDYFFKPFLAVLFNAVLQPLLIFFYNIATSIRDCLDPIAEGIGYFLREVANVLRALRFVEVKRVNCPHECDGQNKS